ncbi:hypothetical protein HCN44_009896 [Aphidius gifuensis]|uniref:RING-type E3 ubiquitin transferase n=1 Tax=Aphidius gifuensis TaxID=684658 RepID=A0A834XNV5_APHGI|nr:hypothetical protein HCN44_009896 [Aphidius gifuensis]
MPIQTLQWTEFLSCPVCCHEFDRKLRGPVSLGCGHTICKMCLVNSPRKQCPLDQYCVKYDFKKLPLNKALLQLIDVDNNSICQYNNNDDDEKQLIVPNNYYNDYLIANKCIEELTLYLKPYVDGVNCLLSRPMQRKLINLSGCQLIDIEGRIRAIKISKSIGERCVTELILNHQNPQEISVNLWTAVRSRGCQFLGPEMQQEILKLILLALEDGSALSRKVLVMFIVQRLELHYPQASKTSIGHVVQLLYRASCFNVIKRHNDSALMELKLIYRNYDALRRQHDGQIVEIAIEAGIRISPNQWSSLLYGDTSHKSYMQSIIDKLQTPQTFHHNINELFVAIQRTCDPTNLNFIKQQLQLLASIDENLSIKSNFLNNCYYWQETKSSLLAIKQVVQALIKYIQLNGATNNHHNHYYYLYQINNKQNIIISHKSIKRTKDLINKIETIKLQT